MIARHEFQSNLHHGYRGLLRWQCPEITKAAEQELEGYLISWRRHTRDCDSFICFWMVNVEKAS
jgi:hypothetical protein